MTTAAPASKNKASGPSASPSVEVPATPAPLAPTAPAPAAAAPSASTPLSITALVLGITGIVLGQGLLSIGALVFGFVARGKEQSGRLIANWGIVLAFVGLFGGFVLGLIGVATFAPLWIFGGLGAWDVLGF